MSRGPRLRDNADPRGRPASGGSSRRIGWAAVVALCALVQLPPPLEAQHTASSELVSIELAPAQRTLNWADAAQQLVVIGTLADSRSVDLTAEAKFVLSHAGVGRIDAHGLFHSLADGETEIKAVVGDREATARFRVRRSAQQRPMSFARDIGGILTKRGCNGAACHGGVKGQNGFRLSDNAGHPHEDYKWIVEGGIYQVMSSESGGPQVPRIDKENPEKSLLLLKPTTQVPHGGGLRFEKGSDDYNTILEWVRRGAPFGEQGSEFSWLKELCVFPDQVFLKRGQEHRFLVTGRYGDGTGEDLTRKVLYEVRESGVAEISSGGFLKGQQPGETFVMIRASGRPANLRVGVVGEELTDYPDVEPFNFIDEHILGKLRRFNVAPAALSSDEEFLRRVCLDLTGALPPVARVREFLEDEDPDKREKLIDILLDSPEYIDYWTYRFADLLRVSVYQNGVNPKWSRDYWEWIRDNVATNRPFDEVARERIAAQGYRGPSRHFLPLQVIKLPPDAMLEQAQVFLGRRFDCARCHDHPYEDWTQDQFWGLTAFFGHMFRTGWSGHDSVVFDYPMGKEIGADVVGQREYRILHPRTQQEVPPTLLDGTVLEHKNQRSVRLDLAEWMTSHEYFAEAAVNRFWSYFFGRGIVDPVDDLRSTNPPTHPELLRALAEEFVAKGYDIKHMFRLIVTSRTYQLAGAAGETSSGAGANYAYYVPRPLDAEVLLDAITDVTGVAEIFRTQGGKIPANSPVREGTRAIALRESDIYISSFLDLYGRPNRASIPERRVTLNLGQALHMLAGETYNNKLWKEGGRVYELYRAGASDNEILDELYLAALTRYPARQERSALQRLMASSTSREEALRNLQWAVLTSREFAENH